MMKRNLGLLDGNSFDVVIIGGGIYGACMAWESVSRGMSVALIEKNDFASATSANSLKIIHGGLRYLQHLDIQRFRESTRERTTLMNIAPHLVHPLPVVIPTYGHGLRGKAVMLGALMVNHWLGLDCKRAWDPARRVPWGQLLSQTEIKDLLPFVSSEGLSGGALFYDAQVYNSERLVLSFLHSAADSGAVLGNYLEVKTFLRKSNQVTGVQVQDRLSGNTFDVRSKIVVNTTGPWGGEIIRKLSGVDATQGPVYAKAVNLIMTPIAESVAFGIPVPLRHRDDRAVVKRGNRMLFVAPWRGRSLVGTIYVPFHGTADECVVQESEVMELLAMVKQACPDLSPDRRDVQFVHGGLLPCTHPSQGPEDIQLKAKYEIYDHREDGIEGIVSVTGVKYTTARLVAQKTVDHLVTRGISVRAESHTHSIPLFGGDIDRFELFLEWETHAHSESVSAEGLQALIRNFGTAYKKVLSYVPGWGLSQNQKKYRNLDLIRGQVRFAVREEMAQQLADFVFRRSEIGAAGYPGEADLKACADEMGIELKWSEQKIQEELKNTQTRFVTAA